MKLRIEFTPSAEDTFDSVIQQLNAQWGSPFVLDFEQRILKNLEIISSNPFIYPVVNSKLQIRKCILHKNCSMLYYISEDVIVIVCFWDNRQENTF